MTVNSDKFSERLASGTYAEKFYDLDEAFSLLTELNEENKKERSPSFGQEAHGYLYYEMWPLYKVAKKLADKKSETKIKFTGPTEPFDGLVKLPGSVEPQKIECVHAIDGHNESIRLEFMRETGSVKGTGPMEYEGTKHNRKWTGDNAVGDAVEIGGTAMLSEIRENVARAISGKLQKAKSGSYNGCWLIVVVHDLNIGALNESLDMIHPALQAAVDNFQPELSEHFERVFLVGSSTEMFWEA